MHGKERAEEREEDGRQILTLSDIGTSRKDLKKTIFAEPLDIANIS
jgi:hypothetical protein